MQAVTLGRAPQGMGTRLLFPCGTCSSGSALPSTVAVRRLETESLQSSEKQRAQGLPSMSGVSEAAACLGWILMQLV